MCVCVCDCVHVITYSKSRHWAAPVVTSHSFHSAQSRGLRWSSWKALATAVTVMQCAEAPPRFHVPSKSVEPCGTMWNHVEPRSIQPDLARFSPFDFGGCSFGSCGRHCISFTSCHCMCDKGWTHVLIQPVPHQCLIRKWHSNLPASLWRCTFCSSKII